MFDNINWLTLLIAVLASYRLSYMLALEDGPADILVILREKLGGYDYDVNGLAKTSLGRLVTCPYCIGMYISLIITLVMFPFNYSFPIMLFAIAGGQAFLQALSSRG